MEEHHYTGPKPKKLWLLLLRLVVWWMQKISKVTSLLDNAPNNLIGCFIHKRYL